MKIKSWVSIVSVLIGSWLVAGQATAQRPCKEDVEKHCAEHKGDRAQMRQCLIANKDKLSDQCRQMIKGKAKRKFNKAKRKPNKAKRRVKKSVRSACEADLKQHCSAVKGKKNKLKCLRDNRENLQPACKTQMRKVRKMRRRFAMRSLRKACRADVKAQCSSVKPGKGRIIACLRENTSKLSQPCQDQLAKMKARRAPKNSSNSEAGANTGADTGADTSAETGTETGAETGAETGTEVEAADDEGDADLGEEAGSEAEEE